VSVVQLAGVDLFFRGKIDAMLAASGHEVVAKPGGPAPDLVIADVNRTDPQEVLARFPGVPVLGFGRHTDPQLLRAARQAGFAKVVARSVLSERLPELVDELARS
jgi:DNA-binding NarL/FixJ family response regulator